jgi:hypothetical protein
MNHAAPEKQSMQTDGMPPVKAKGAPLDRRLRLRRKTAASTGRTMRRSTRPAGRLDFRTNSERRVRPYYLT